MDFCVRGGLGTNPPQILRDDDCITQLQYLLNSIAVINFLLRINPTLGGEQKEELSEERTNRF